MHFPSTIVAAITDENMSSMTSLAASKKRKRLSEQAPPKDSTKRSTLSATNGNAEHVINGQESFSESNSTAKDNNDGSEPDISTTAAAALTAHLNEGRGLSFASGASVTEDRAVGESFDMDHPRPSSSGYSYSPTHGTPRTNGSSSQKPAVGTEEWHKVRRDNHKEVERRRRETINEGINELAKIVPGCEKNKGAVLAQAVTYIRDLKNRQDMASEQKSMEKSVLEQAVDELMSRNEVLKERITALEEHNHNLEQKLEQAGIKED